MFASLYTGPPVTDIHMRWYDTGNSWGGNGLASEVAARMMSWHFMSSRSCKPARAW